MKDLLLTMILEADFSDFLKTLFIITSLMTMILILIRTTNQESSNLLVHQNHPSLYLMNSIRGSLLLSPKSKFAEKPYNTTFVSLRHKYGNDNQCRFSFPHEVVEASYYDHDN